MNPLNHFIKQDKSKNRSIDDDHKATEEKAWKDKVKQHIGYLNQGSDTHSYTYEEAERDLINIKKYGR